MDACGKSKGPGISGDDSHWSLASFNVMPRISANLIHDERRSGTAFACSYNELISLTF